MRSNGLTGIVKLFIVHAKQNNILELNKNELRENFFKFINTEKYENLLQMYEYDENNICIQLERELIDLIKHKQISEYKDCFYIYGIRTDYSNAYSDDINFLVRQMVADYIILNMQKQKVNVG